MAAVVLGNLVCTNAKIAEVGSANGRDARYWAMRGHTVHCMDFSSVALGQLVQEAKRQGVEDRINPLLFDANLGTLPGEVGEIDGFYARSALHVDDATLMSLLTDVDDHLSERGAVVIEGKSTADPKITRSVPIGDGLVADPVESGHVRRVWTPDMLKDICRTFGWTALEQSSASETWRNTDANFLRLVAKK